MIQFLKRLWCFITRHDWEADDDRVIQLSDEGYFTCRRCGKRVELYESMYP